LRFAIADLRLKRRIANRRIVNRILQIVNESGFWFRFAETRDTVAGLALAALFKKRRALETFEDIALAAQSGRRAETAML